MAFNGYKRAIAEYFDSRTDYNRSKVHAQLADRLVRLVAPQPNERVLDIATGTGFVAIPVARLVGEQGMVVGVDISTGMLDRAREAVAGARLSNIELRQADAEWLDYPERSFDLIVCCNALPYMTDVRTTLRQWYALLRPGGRLAFNCWAEQSYATGRLLRAIAARHGIRIATIGRDTGTPDRCRAILAAVGFIDPEVVAEHTSSFFSVDRLEEALKSIVNNPLYAITSGDAARLESLRSEYMAEAGSPLLRQDIDAEVGAYFVWARAGSIRSAVESPPDANASASRHG